MNIYTHDRVLSAPSNRSFAIVMAIAFLFFALWPLTKGYKPNYILIAISAGFIISGYFFQQLLNPLNKIWFKIGIILHKIVNPLVMGVLFFIVFTPLSLVLRAVGFDLLGVKLNKSTASYWVLRDKEQTGLETQY